jgi:hypothetical protein
MMDSPTPKRKARPIRHQVALHLFTTGQIVRLKDRFSLQSQTAATYRITAVLPPRGDSLQYRIRNDDEVYERVAMQASLEPVRISPAGGSGALVQATFGQLTEPHQSPDAEAEVGNGPISRRPEMKTGHQGNADGDGTEFDGRALAISVWENEGGARAFNPDGQFGRRVEMDSSWTIYHVFTGVPARVDGSAMTHLSGSAATDGMLSLNRRNVKRQRAERANAMNSRPKE